MGLIFSSWASRIPDIKVALQLSDGQLGQLLMALPCGQLATMALSAWLEGRFGSKHLTRLALLAYASMLVVASFCHSPFWLGMALLAMGSLGNVTSISVNTQGVLAEKLVQRPIMSAFHGVWSLAGFSGALLGLLMMNFKVSITHHFTLVAALVGLVALLVQPFLIESAARAKPPKKARLPWQVDSSLVPLGLIGFCSLATEGSMFDWSGVYFREVVQVHSSLVLLGYAAFMVCMTTGRFVGDKIVGRWGRLAVLRTSGYLMSLGLFLGALFPYTVPATLAFMLVGFGVSSVIPNIYSLAGRSSKVEPGVALASVASVSYLGFLLGPPLIGAVASATSLRVSYAIIGILGLLISLVVPRLAGPTEEPSSVGIPATSEA